MTYTLTSCSYVIRDVDNATIPNDPDNMDWQAYQDWLTAGNTPSPAPVVSMVPQSVSDRQFFQAAAVQGAITPDEAIAYVAMGTLPAILNTAIGQLPADQQFAVRMKVIGANSFNRTDGAVLALSAALGWTSAQVDDLFTLANTL